MMAGAGEAIFEEVGKYARAIVVRKGAEVLQENGPRVMARIAQADADLPTFSTGATTVIAVVALATGAFVGWNAKDWMQK